MRKSILLIIGVVLSVVVLTVNSVSMAGTVYIDNGLSHTIDDWTYGGDIVILDNYFPYYPSTHVNLVSGGKIYKLNPKHSSTVAMTGGEITYFFSVYDDSSVTITGGEVNIMYGCGNSSITMSGGSAYTVVGQDSATITMTGGTVETSFSVQGSATIAMTNGLVNSFGASENGTAIMTGGVVEAGLTARVNGIVIMSGGSVGSSLTAQYSGIIYLQGTDFAVTDTDGATTNLSYGDRLSGFGTLIENGDNDYYEGTITGTLANGSFLDNRFSIHNIGYYEGVADIIIIPEPATLLFLGLGGLILRRVKQ